MSSVNAKRRVLQKLRAELETKAGFGDAASWKTEARPKSGWDQGLLAHGLHEVIGEGPGGAWAAIGFAFAAAALACGLRRKPLLVLGQSGEVQERGLLHGAGLGAVGLDPAQVFTVSLRTEKEKLWACEEAVSCPALGAVLMLPGRRERLYGFTASRRLKLRQEASGVPAFILRPEPGETTAALARWHVAHRPSRAEEAPGAPLPLPGAPRFAVRLERHAGLPPQEWEIERDATLGLRLAAPLPDRPSRTDEPRGRRAA